MSFLPRAPYYKCTQLWDYDENFLLFRAYIVKYMFLVFICINATSFHGHFLGPERLFKNIYFKPANSLKFVCFLFSLAAISCVLYNTGLIWALELSRKEFWEFTSKIACRRATETSREKSHLF